MSPRARAKPNPMPATVVLLNGVFGSDTWTDQWQFWFLEAVVWAMLAVLAPFAVGIACWKVCDFATRAVRCAALRPQSRCGAVAARQLG